MAEETADGTSGGRGDGPPDFDRLFRSPDDQGDPMGLGDARRLISPRLAARLWLAASLLADEYLQDSDAYEQRLPPIALDRGDEFAARLHQAASELRDDIERGDPPTPRSTGEAVVLGWVLDDALATASGDDDTTNDLAAELVENLSRTAHDTDDPHHDVHGLYDTLFEDLDYETLYSPELDGIEDSAHGRELGMESLRPADWFIPYPHLTDVLPARPEYAAPPKQVIFTLEAKVSFRVTNPQAVHDAAVALLTDPGTHFDSDQAREEEVTRVQLSLTDALLTLADASNVLANIPGAQDHGSVVGIETGNTT